MRTALWIFAVLVALVIFNAFRWSLVADCHREGGVWDGSESKCRMIPARLFPDGEQIQT